MNVAQASRNAQLRALAIGIDAIEHVRRERYAAGHAAYMQGVRPDEIKGKINGIGFAWAQQDHEKYLECSEAIRQLEDLQEILTDPGVTTWRK
jgi:hypothetical protein